MLRAVEVVFCRVDLDLSTAVVRLKSLRLKFVRRGVGCDSEPTSRARFLPPFDALRKEAGVMFGDASSSESQSSSSELDIGVLGLLDGARPVLPIIVVLVRRKASWMREDLLIDFKAPGLTTFRCMLTVVCLVDLREPLMVRRTTVGRDRLEMVEAEDRFIARSSRDAICLECAAASASARSRASLLATSIFLTLVVAGCPI